MSEGPDTQSQAHSAPEPDAEQLRAYFEQLRPAPAEHVLTDLLSSALMAAQAKLGRHDARLLIDTAGLVFDHVRTYLGDETSTQIERALNELRMAQVQAEQTATAAGQSEENDLPQQPAPPAAPSAGASTPAAPQQPAAASKLWVPGR